MRMTSVDKLTQLALQGEEWKGWYDTAHISITEWCLANDVDLLHFVAVLAIISPRMSVGKNVSLAKAYFVALKANGSEVDTHRHVPGLIGKTHRRALEKYEHSGTIDGRKTKAFADALLGNGNAIVLDTHMATALGVNQDKLTKNKRVFTKACDRVTAVAKRLQWTPAEVQAAIWTAVYKSKHTEQHLASNGRIEDYL